MSVYNSEKFVAAAIKSVLQQTHRDFEFLIVNNGSTDSSAEILKKFAAEDSRIRVLDKPYAPLGDGLNFGLEHATHEWVFRLDADDIMYPERIEKQIEFIEAHPDLRVTACRGTYIDHENNIAGKTGLDVLSADDCKKYVEKCEPIGLLHPGAALHKSTILEVGGYRSQFNPADDIDLWNRVAEAGHMVYGQDEVLMKYRLHLGSDIAQAYFTARDKYDWVRNSMKRRRNNLEELSWEDFQNELEQHPPLKKLNRKRKILAKKYFRLAGLHYVSQKKNKAFVELTAAVALQPDYAFNRIFRLSLSLIREQMQKKR